MAKVKESVKPKVNYTMRIENHPVKKETKKK